MDRNNTGMDTSLKNESVRRGYTLYAIIGGVGAGILSAALWALITVLFKYQIGYMSIGVGFLVGFTVRYFGEGEDLVFGFIGGTISLVSCIFGNLLSQIAMYAIDKSLQFWDVITTLNYTLIPQILIESAHPMDLLFYGIAIYAGFRFSLNKKSLPAAVKNEDPAQKPTYPRSKLIVLFIIFTVILGTGVVTAVSSDKMQTFEYSSGKKQCEGRLSGGLAQGTWTYWYESGGLQAEITFKNNKKEGVAKTYYENGELSTEGMYENGLLHGEMKVYSDDGRLYSKGYYQFDRKHGLFLEYNNAGTLISRGMYKNGLQDGKWEYWYENGNKKEEGNFENGEPRGIQTYWYENGNKKQESEYQDGEELIWNYWDGNGNVLVDRGNGVFSSYFENGQLNTRGKIKNGRKVDEWKTWYDNGTLNSQSKYENNKSVLIDFRNKDGKQLVKNGNGLLETFYEDGTKMSSAHYKDGFLEGNYTMWYDNGDKLGELMYLHGELEGETTYYHQNNVTSARGNFKMGKREGLWQWWDEDGTLSSEVTFVDGLKEGIQVFWVNEVKIKEEEYKNNELVKTRVF